MNSISHQQRMMEIQHMSNACLVTLLPRVQESLQGTNKEGCVHIISLFKLKPDLIFFSTLGFKVLVHICPFLSREKKDDMKHWCSTCHTHFTSSLPEHRRTEEHKVISRLRHRWMHFHRDVN